MMGFSSVMILPFMPCGILEKLLSQDHIVSVFTSCDDLLKKKQFCYILARHGTILLWDTDIELAQIDKFIHSNDNYVIAGELLGVRLVNCNVYSHLDPAKGILHEYIDNEDSSIRIGAIMGLGIAYAVTLALGLLCMSNPKVNVVDILSRLSHDTDLEVVMAAIISLGLIGAGTNNARIVFMLRNLSSYYYRIASLLFCVQIAQGLVHLGKGLLTLDPYHCDHFLLSPTALAGLVTTLHACLDLKEIILGKYHFVLYFLVLAIQPRMLMTLDENLKPLSVPVRVGQAVDIAGKAGQPKTITGFQTFTTPVLLAAGQRAELATEMYIPLTPTLEGHVILIENPEYRGDN
ncbi:hypothetical protein GQ457_02G010040 [Hibiscus cannabinus]